MDRPGCHRTDHPTDSDDDESRPDRRRLTSLTTRALPAFHLAVTTDGVEYVARQDCFELVGEILGRLVGPELAHGLAVGPEGDDPVRRPGRAGTLLQFEGPVHKADPIPRVHLRERPVDVLGERLR